MNKEPAMVTAETIGDGELHRTIDAIKRRYRAAVTRAERTRIQARDAALARFGCSDVEQAARHNTIRRAEIRYEEAIGRASTARNVALADLRSRAGRWVDLVPAYNARHSKEIP